MSTGSSRAADARYWAALSEGHLELQRCATCQSWHWPAVFRCAQCGSWEQQWVEMPLRGTVFTWTRTHQEFPGTENLPKPFVTASVVIDSTPVRLLGVVDGVEEGIHIGAHVTGHLVSSHSTPSDRVAIRWSLV